MTDYSPARFSVQSDFSLLVENVTDDDDGVYTCSIQSDPPVVTNYVVRVEGSRFLLVFFSLLVWVRFFVFLNEILSGRFCPIHWIHFFVCIYLLGGWQKKHTSFFTSMTSFPWFCVRGTGSGWWRPATFFFVRVLWNWASSGWTHCGHVFIQYLKKKEFLIDFLKKWSRSSTLGRRVRGYSILINPFCSWIFYEYFDGNIVHVSFFFMLSQNY